MDETPLPSETAIPAVQPLPPAHTKRWWPVLLLMLVTFAAGIAATVWAWPHIQEWQNGEVASEVPRTVQPIVALTNNRPVSGNTLNNDAAQMLDSRVVQLEERLNRITVEAQAASGNASRAEGLLIAFAARRALDSGTSLGYIEGQLRLRFGTAQPRAVATIINAAREPITLGDLRFGLSELTGQITQPPAQSWWQAVEHEARELISFRRTSTPSARPQAAFDRAKQYVDAGRVADALQEVEHMPGREAAGIWMQLARRYLEARRALDLIETAAILEPRPIRPVDGEVVAPAAPITR